jgi:hypothetical protein
VLVEFVAFGKRPIGLGFFAERLGNVRIDSEAVANLEGDENAFAVVTELKTVVPVGGQSAGQVVLSRAFEIEFDRATEVAEHGGLTLVRVG